FVELREVRLGQPRIRKHDPIGVDDADTGNRHATLSGWCRRGPPRGSRRGSNGCCRCGLWRSRSFTSHVSRRFIAPKPLKTWMADLPFAGPFGERALHHQPWPNPMRVLSEPPGRTRIECGRRLFDRVKSFPQVSRTGDSKSGAHLSGEHEPSFIEVPDQQGTDALSRAFGIGKSSDHELLSQNAFRLDPSAMTSWEIFRVGEF